MVTIEIVLARDGKFQRRVGNLLQAVNIIRLSDADVLGFEFAHDIGDLASIVDAEVEQRAARGWSMKRSPGYCLGNTFSWTST